ncbi:lactate dehydrogenase [Agaricicola taiwanensis]|uniref:Lactate dehydrogenase n=1 Tax=Agaricicola taiwanensis TaxID=591372 RepID=A0A8J2YF22_9RHOB|nr:Ldh family oxidoreductase [Agaricicola taiwanensis]GGE27624.1 lactate dehydrogenase [Agaricicola taiwanensis]
MAANETVARPRHVSPTDLEPFVARIFAGNGVPQADAERVAQCLVEADLRGVSSHGVGRIPIYTERLRKGLVKAKPTMSVERPTSVTAQVNGDDGLGFVVATKAMSEAIDIARECGIAFVTAFNSAHFGMAASYLKMAVKENMAAFVFTNASPAMPIWGGREPFLGTSPFAFAAPAGKNHPGVMLDMATSVVARGKIRRAAQKGEPIPLGWALDADGKPTTDAQKGYDGIILPLGGPKGSGLSLMMEVIGGVMSGAAFGGQVRNQYFDFDAPQNVGHAFIVMQPGIFVGPEAYASRMDELVERAKANPRAEGFEEILMPGEPEARSEAQRRREGIPLGADDVATLVAEADLAKVERPAFLAN